MNGNNLSPIPQTDPKRNYLAHRDEIDEAIKRVLEKGYYILYDEVREFEKEFADFIGVNYGIGVANGTDAIEIALRACGIGPGDLVFTVSHTAVATIAAIELVGAVPVFVDINPSTYTLDPESLKEALFKSSPGKPKALIVVHLYGNPADMELISQIARHYNLFIIEDCAQSHGAKLNGCITGSIGDIATFSFYPTKNLGAIGDGGMVVTNDSTLAEKVNLLRQYGWRDRYISEIPGMNSRLDELQAAILRVKLKYLKEENQKRHKLAQLYDELLANTDFTLPVSQVNAYHVYHQYVIRSAKRDVLASCLRENAIGTLIHYPVPVHLQPAYKDRIPLLVPLLQTELAAIEVLSLPMYPQLTEYQVRRVCSFLV